MFMRTIKSSDNDCCDDVVAHLNRGVTEFSFVY